MRELPAAFGAMGAYRQFIIYVTQPSRTRPGKIDKFPCDYRTGQVVDAHKEAIWTDARAAIVAAANFGPNYGVAFVFTENDPFWFLDIDDCLLPDGSDWSPLANQLCSMFAGAAVEVSVSGKGLHIFGTGAVPHHSNKREDLHIEFYTTKRFVALTGTSAVGSSATDFSHMLPAFVATTFPPVERAENGWTDAPVADWIGPTDDEELLRRAMRSQSTNSVFGNKASFAELWTADENALTKAFPDDRLDRPYNASSVDAALAQHLAFWTGNNCERMRSLMERSALVRDKWDRRGDDYLARTILNATAMQGEVLQDKVLETLSVVVSLDAPTGHMVTGSTFAGAEDQLKLFAGCVYVQDQHRVLIPGGYLLKPEQFKVAYGGYTFTMDTANEKVTRDPWEALTQNQSYRCAKANTTCFKPDLPAGTLVNRNNQILVNTYHPVEVRRIAGDVTPFLTHLGKVLPDPRDALILLSYMAACVQHKGFKFQWAPLLQGVEGNGKTLFTRCVAEAVGRRYVHWPKASKLTKDFNGWMVGKLFYGVEDIYTPDHKREVFEELKPMITGGDGLEIERKGVDQVSDDICGNFMFNCNNKSGLRKTRNDRRICVFYTAQQSADDVVVAGMGGDYFQKLYEWLRGDGYAIVADYLHTFAIPDELNPAKGCQRAPITSTTEAAITEGCGSIEQEIQEAVAQGLPGFCGGWISSIQLERLLERIGASRRVSHNKRKEILADLGYIPHPALIDGRVNNLVLPDNGKPRLFIQATNSIALALPNPGIAAKSYETANNHARVPFPFQNNG